MHPGRENLRVRQHRATALDLSAQVEDEVTYFSNQRA